MVADKLQRQEEERIQCSPNSQIDNLGEEEMDTSISHHKRKVHKNKKSLLNLTELKCQIQEMYHQMYHLDVNVIPPSPIL